MSRAAKTTVRRFAGGGLVNPLQAVGDFFNGSRSAAPDPGSAMPGMSAWGGGLSSLSRTSPAQDIAPGAVQPRRDSNPIQKLDQQIAMGNAMGGLSNTERYQMANPTNAAYTIGGKGGVGSVTPGSSADASMQRQQTGIMGTLRDKLAEQPLYAGFADGGEVNGAETPEQLMDRMAKKYGNPGAGTGTPTPAPAPQAAPTPVQQPAQQPAPEKKGLFGIIGTLTGRKAQIDKEVEKATNGYANGGKIQGPGTPTSDSIPARIKETGENIAVSNEERIVSKPQDNLLQLIAKGIGFNDLDSMLEAGTGKPVGPTIKGGMAHAANGKWPFWQGEDVPQLTSEGSAANRSTIESKPGYQAGPIPLIDTIAQGIGDFGRRAVAGEFNGRGGLPISEAFAPPPAVPANTARPASIQATVPQAQASYSNEGRSVRADQAMNQAAGTQRIAEAPGFAGQRMIDRGNQGYMVAGTSNVDATQMQAPNGGGMATSGKKAIFVPGGQTYTGADGKQTEHWTDTQDYKDAIARQASNVKLADQMQHDRLVRDTGSDIKDPSVRLAARQQLAQLGHDQGMALLAQRGLREDATAGMDQQLKGQQIAQLTQDADLRMKVMNGNPAAIEMWNRIHPKDQEEFGAVALKETDPTTGGVTERLAPYSKRTGLAPTALGQTKAIAPDMQTYARHVRENNKGKTVSDADIKAAYEKQFGAK